MADQKNNPKNEKSSKNYDDKIEVGFTAKVTIVGLKDEISAMARVDTGARTSSLDMKMAADLNLGPIVETRFVKSASGQSVRPIIKAKMIIQGKEFEAEFTIANRRNLEFPVLIGRNILQKGFIINPDVEE
jgi:hypothetical protein